ncbi:MAG: SUMF1/EgtB/PvdO family nonheme iron enzyme [Cyanobacteria bacterium J06650_10]
MKKYALLIGVSDYTDDSLQALPAATQDAAELGRVLEMAELGGFEAVQLLLNPTREEMAVTVERWLAERQADELALLFFSGHGVKDERRSLHFATGNTQKVNNRLMRATAFAARTLNDFLKDCRAKQQVVILDCCFSGAFGELQPRDVGELELERQLAAEGRVVLTSTSSVDYAFEEKGSELSAYTRYLVEGIEKGTAARSGSEFVTVEDLHAFASRKVRETAPAMSPEMITLKGQPLKILLARSPQDKPELRYRKEVEKRSRKGKITRTGRRMLDSLRQQYGLIDEVADTIEDEVQKPFRDYQRKLNEYAVALADCVEAGEIDDRYHLIDLKDYQKHLGLKDSDVWSIEKGRIGRVLLVEEINSGEAVGSEEEQAEERQQKQSQSKTQKQSTAEKRWPTFSFATVWVNDRGKEIEKISGEAEYFIEDLGGGVGLEMVRIPAGQFLMGASEGEEGASDDEYPQHEVMVPEFWMGKFAVTQAQWKAIAATKKVAKDLKLDPSKFKGAKRPVECVSWQDAIEFCERLSQRAGRAYSLLSEAQWEYACRASTTTPFYFGSTITTDLVNYRGTDLTHDNEIYPGNYGQGPKGENREETLEVGNFSPNHFGLHDMHGNVWEWCMDDWHDSYRGAPSDGSVRYSSKNENKVIRGGSWFFFARNCRSAYRSLNLSGFRDFNVGFRVCCSVPRT